ncbi:MAG: magnesium transporter CorA family protein [Lentisphaerae bacterium]|nr:magnesium transporter CorA family protein [Lentisphaerota bacterium]
MIKRFNLEDGRLAEASEGGAIQIYVAPDEREKKDLIEVYKIDPHNLDSSLDPDEIGRMEFEPDHLAVIVKRPKNYSSSDNFLFRVISMGVFLFKDRMILVMAENVNVFEGKQTFKFRTLHDVLIKLLYGTISHFMGHLKVINMLSDSLETKINKSMENKFLLNMFTLEKSLVFFLNGVNHNATIIEKLKVSAVKLGFSPENVEWLDDIMIDNSQCQTLVQTYANILSGLMDARASVVSNNLNVMMKNLNAIVIAVMVPSFIAGVGGMSEWTMMTGAGNWKLSYGLFLLGNICLGVFIYFFIRRLEKLESH